MEQSAADKGETGFDRRYGFGRLDAFNAVIQVAPVGRLDKEAAPPPPDNTCKSPVYLWFDKAWHDFSPPCSGTTSVVVYLSKGAKYPTMAVEFGKVYWIKGPATLVIK